jgi:hydrogenase nickel incorporation protein HypA/HybF
VHEVGIAESIISIAAEHARAAGAARVNRVAVRVGALSGVVREALDFAFDVARQGTVAADAVLEVEEVPVTARCPDCQQAFTSDDPYGICLCPTCGQPVAELLTGRELDVAYLEVV